MQAPIRPPTGLISRLVAVLQPTLVTSYKKELLHNGQLILFKHPLPAFVLNWPDLRVLLHKTQQGLV